MRTAILGLGVVSGLGAIGAGCLTRPVTSSAPSLKTNVTIDVRNQSIDKVDILFSIDNSASMGDKQEFFAQAVPKLVGRLVNPYCTDANGSTVDGNGNLYGSSNFGDCSGVAAAGPNSKSEFPPVHDMHIGIVTTSIGSVGANSCSEDPTQDVNPVNKALSGHNNDRAHLIARGDPAFNAATPTEVLVADAANAPSQSGKTCDANGTDADFCSPGFLAWLPNVPQNSGKVAAIPITDQNKLITDFQEMVQGVHEYGCGLESMLESWYRFLIQPDPYDNIPRADLPTSQGGTGGRAQLQGVDATILQQRHDFLRPDSLVAIILITDENDSAMDPQWYGGQGWAFNNLLFPGSTSTGGGAPKGTTTCQNTPSDQSCTGASCAFCTSATQADPNCGGPCTGSPPTPPAAGYWTGQQDNVNLRHVHMRQKYGVDPQYPVTRYLHGLTNPKVPNRACEHNNNCSDSNQANWAGSSLYVGDNNAICTNPLFAATLSTATSDDPNNPQSSYCTLTPGSRTPDLVFFAAITGVPYQLLHFVPNNPDKSKLSDSDWVSILGQGPAGDPNQAGLTDVLQGIDEHMVESNVPRGNGIPSTICNPSNGTCSDPIVGSDWNSNQQDLMFACTFPFSNGLVKDCTAPQYVNACDCENGNLPPLCDATTPTKQNRAKAYPGIRQLALVRALKDQGIAASICPQEVNDQTSPVYGYGPAVESIIDRLKTQLANQCLPQPLQVDSAGNVPCLILAVLGQPGPQSICGSGQYPGLSQPDPQVLSKYIADEEAAYNAPGGGKSQGLPDPATFPVCQVNEIPGVAPGQTCLGNQTPGWCYVVNTAGQTGGPAGACPQAIIFSQSSVPPTGSTTHLECIEASNSGADGGT